jgi:hypothetical protein
MDLVETQRRIALLLRKRTYMIEHGADAAKIAEFSILLTELGYAPEEEEPVARKAEVPPEPVAPKEKRPVGRPRKAVAPEKA